MPAERTKLDFLCQIRRSAIGQASCLNCERSRQLTFPLCCYVYVGTEGSQRWFVCIKAEKQPLLIQLYFETVWNVVKMYLNDLKTIFTSVWGIFIFFYE